jgi:hypothetical protein
MPFTTYAELRETAARWLARDDLADDFPDLIRLAQKRIERKLDQNFTQLEKSVTGNLISDQEWIELPADLIEPRLMTIMASPRRIVEIVSSSVLESVREHGSPGNTIAGHVSGMQDPLDETRQMLVMQLAPMPGASTEYKLTYWAGLAAYDDASNPSDILLSEAPDVLLYAILLEASPFVGDDERAIVWQPYFEEAVGSYRRQLWRRRTGGGPLRIRPDRFA